MSKISSFILFVGLLALLYFGNVFKGSYRFVDEAFDFGHLLLFGTLSLVVLIMISNKRRRQSNVKPYVLAGIITFLLGFITECIQIFLPEREFGLRDLLYNACGAGIFLSNWFAFSNKKIAKAVKRNIIISSTLIIGICFWPTVTAIIDEKALREDFPIIGSFERKYEILRWKTQDSKINRTSIYRTHGSYSMEVKLNPGTFPGMSLRYFPHDWSKYSLLVFDLYLLENKPFDLIVRINDKEHNSKHEDRYNQTFKINPGLNEVSIPLENVKNAPKGRSMDMRQIVNITIFSYKLKEKRSFFIDNVTLSNF